MTHRVGCQPPGCRFDCTHLYDAPHPRRFPTRSTTDMPTHESGSDYLVSAAHATLVVQHAAFFLDFDGTLVELAATPDAVVVPDSLKHLLAALADLSGGAVAIVSGRSIENIDAMLAPLVLPVAGLHGAEWRDAQGAVVREFVADPRLAQMADTLSAVVAANPGLLLETK